MYELLIWLTGAAGLGLAVIGYCYTRDIFHPVVFIGPMTTYSYCVVPLLLHRDRIVEQYVPVDYLPVVQGIYLAAVSALCLGAIAAGRPRRSDHVPSPFSPKLASAIARAGIVLGMAGAFAFAYTVINVGGLANAYGSPHSQGWAGSGYIREARFLVVPGLAMLLISRIGRRIRPHDLVWVVLIISPLAFHAIFSASRGPTFMVLVTVIGGLYIVRNRRPTVFTFVAGATLGAALVLSLVAYRNVLYYGSDFELQDPNVIVNFAGRDSRGSEYIFGSGLIVSGIETGEYQWGGRYVLRIFIRLIPRQIWPTQYEDTREFLGLPENLHVVTQDTLGWNATDGSSPGMVAAMWLQFWVFTFPVLFAIGYAHGAVWRRSIRHGGVWTMVFIVMLSLTVFLTQQTLQSMLFRFLFLGGGGWIAWRIFVQPAWQREQRLRRRAQRLSAAASRSRAGADRQLGNRLPSGL